MEATNIYEPIREYESKYRNIHKENVSEYFEKLAEKAQVDEDENKKTVKQVKKHEEDIKFTDKKIKRFKNLKTFLIVIIIISFIVGFLFFLALIKGVEVVNKGADIAITLGSLLLGGGLIFLLSKKVNVILKNTQDFLVELKKKYEEQLKIAWDQMSSLNALFDWGMPAEIVEKTMPLIKMDKYFDPKRYDILHNKYKLPDNSNPDVSILFSQSGEILGNPFVFGKKANHYMGTKIYTGTLTISWTQRVRQSDGSYTSIRKTQVLTARLKKPNPEYYFDSFLIYGNEAAPDLSFSRTPKKAEKLSEKQVGKLVKKGSRKIQKKVRKTTTKGGGFTAMTDEEFDVLFGATDRNHEVQFRLLFTPLAQRQMLKIIKDDKVGFGDDFSFIKNRMLNTIAPAHLVKADIDTNPNKYITYDFAKTKKLFNDYNNSYFKSIYFSFAPLLAIPLYQQYKAKEYIYKDFYESNVSCWEHEAIVNYFKASEFKHPASDTYNILKTRLVSSIKGADELEVTAHGFQAFKELEYVRMRGGDGYFHNVPVYWYRYEPVSKQSNVIVKTADDLNRNTYIKEIMAKEGWAQFLSKNALANHQLEFRRNIIAYTTDTKLNPLDINHLDTLLYNQKNKKKEA